MRDLKTIRTNAGMTQLELAARSGITNVTLCNIETGNTIPQKQMRKTLESILCQKINWIATSGIPSDPEPVEWEDAELKLRSTIYEACGLSSDELKTFIQVMKEYTYTLENLTGEIEPLIHTI